jgi:hypothetical protein
MNQDLKHVKLLFQLANKIKTPLSLAGFLFIVIYLLYNKILSMKIFSNLSSDQSYLMINNILFYLFVIAVISLILGISSYLIIKLDEKKYSGVIESSETTKKGNIEIVDIEVISTEEFPIIEYKLRNCSGETVFIKEIEILPIERWVIQQPFQPKAVPVTWVYDICLPDVGESKKYKLSQAVKPNEVDRFQLKIKGEDFAVIGQTLYLLKINFIFNEDNKKSKENYIILNMPSEVDVLAYFNPGYSNEIINNNKYVASKLLGLISKQKITYESDLITSLQSWVDAPEKK